MGEPTLRERAETAGVRGLLRLPPKWLHRLAGAPTEVEGHALDPLVQLVIKVRTLAGKKGPGEVELSVARHEMDVAGRQLGPPPADLASVTSSVVAGRPVRIYVPRGLSRPAPATVFFHGGGFVVGSLDSHDLVCRQLAAELPCVVVSVDYRLAPEHPFPAAIDDATAAFREVVARAEALGVDPARIGVAGDSAGGNLATLVSLETQGDPQPPRAVLAIYPATDFTMSARSHETLGTGFFLERPDIEFYRGTYLAGADPKHPRASPLFRDDLDRVPPTVVLTAGFDPLRDEGDAWAEKLKAAGVEVEHLVNPSLFHGFWNCGGCFPAAAAAIDAGHAAYRAKLLG